MRLQVDGALLWRRACARRRAARVAAWCGCSPTLVAWRLTCASVSTCNITDDLYQLGCMRHTAWLGCSPVPGVMARLHLTTRLRSLAHSRSSMARSRAVALLLLSMLVTLWFVGGAPPVPAVAAQSPRPTSRQSVRPRHHVPQLAERSAQFPRRSGYTSHEM